MQSQDLLLLQLLKFPVIIIKFVARVFSILTYLPNYIVIYFIDSLLFNPQLSSTRNLYIISWLPKVIMLVVTVSLFAGQFLLIFHVLELSQHGLTIQIIGMILTLAGLLILMRKGYLSMLEKYNLAKLKSPMEHAELGIGLLVDVVGILLWIVNGLMLINIHRSWDYEYSADTKYRFLKHITGLIKDSCISYIEFFYIKIFFKMFTWRFVREMATYQKEKQEKNVLNCLVLLTLIYLITCLDLLVVGLFGLPCLIHFHRRHYIQRMKTDHEKYKVTLREFLFISLQGLQLIIEAICLVFCWKNGWKAIKTLVKYNQTKELFGKELKELIIETLLKIPYLTATLIIAISVYKLKRRNYLRAAKKKQPKKEEQQGAANIQKSEWQMNENLEITFTCLGELLLDLCFIPFIIIGTVLKPWKYWWFKHIINSDYTLARKVIYYFFFKNVLQLLTMPLNILLSLLLISYDIRKPFGIYKEACERVERANKKIDGSAPNPEMHSIAGKSELLVYTSLSVINIKADFPHLPEFFIAKMTLLNLYLPDITPETTPHLFIVLQRAYFYLTVKRSARFQEYLAMFHRIQASGGITDIKQEYRFWKYSYKCQRLILVQKIFGILLPKVSVQRIKKKIEKPTQFSQISNHYWHQSELTKAMILRLIYLIIEIILSIIGALFLFPLTLWRIPTFVKLFSFHRSRKFFFPILLRVYKQMFADIITLPFKIIAMLVAPKMYLSFIFKTSFKYGTAGLDTFGLYQRIKTNYFMQNILKANLFGILVHCQVVFIVIFWIRIKSLKIALRTYRLTLLTLYTDRLLASSAVPTMEQMITQPKISSDAYVKTKDIASFVSQIFREAMVDLPYLLLILFIFITMPWRITYIIHTIKDMRDDTAQRKSFFKLLRNIFKDYACIFMNILLLVSIFKTKKALFLIKRNYRLNFFKGFLEYSYYNELIKQIIALGIIYKNVFFLIFTVLFGWTRAHQLASDLLALRKKQKEEQESSAANKKIYDNTIKSGKQLQTLHKMGYYNYITVCSFLNVSEIIKLKQVDKFNYMMTQRQEIWFMKWESIYSKTSSQASDNFQLNCKNAYIAQKNFFKRVTYEQIIMDHFQKNVFLECVDLREFLRGKLPQRQYDKVFKNYEFSMVQGYGPENELPQQENEDEDFLRLTNQVRRPIVELQEEMAWLHLLYFRMVEYLVQKMHRIFRENSHRRKKQLVLVAVAASNIIGLLLFIFLFRNFIFCIDSLIMVKLLVCFYYVTFIYALLTRIGYIYFQWLSLIPFDIYYDVVDFIEMLKQSIKDYVVVPAGNFLVKCGRFIEKVINKILDGISWIGNKVKRASIRVKNATVEYSILFYEKVVKPLYVSIADKIRNLIKFLTVIFRAIFRSIKSLLIFIGSLFSSFYKAIRAVFSNINKLYYFILQSSMLFLLKFGFIGNLIFTLFGLVIMTLPSIIWWFFYQKRWYLIASTIHTMVLIVVGYKHLNKIRSLRQ